MSEKKTETAAAPLVPPTAGETWAAAVLERLDAFEHETPERELDELLTTMPVDGSFWKAFDEMLNKFNIYNEPDVVRSFLSHVEGRVRQRVERQAELIKRLVGGMMDRARALAAQGVSSADPLVYPAQMPEMLFVPVLGMFCIVCDALPPSHPLADIEPVALADGNRVLFVGSTKTARTFRHSAIARLTATVRNQLAAREAAKADAAKIAADLEQQERRRTAEGQEALRLKAEEERVKKLREKAGAKV